MFNQPNHQLIDLMTFEQMTSFEQSEIEKYTFLAETAFDDLRQKAEKSASEYVNAVDLFELKYLLKKAGFGVSLPMATIAFAQRNTATVH
ncbi:hypothetical protein [Vibrio sp. 10N.239.312.D08]|uniref:hypothetical protein n=1 Tax=Vibrio sp. 10N.239.312.D08 TaxID=3229978 RepID=UPI0035532405